MIHIDSDKCTKCGACIAVCPALIIEKKNDVVTIAYPKSCISCYHCVGVCPAGAVSCDEFPAGEFRKAADLKKPAPAELAGLLARRRSVREFRNKEIPRALIEEIIADAAHAASGHNDRSVNLSVITDKPLIDKLDRRIFRIFETIGGIADNPLAKRLVKTFGGDKAADSFGTMLNDLCRFRDADDDRKLMIFRNAPALIVAHSSPSATTGKDDCVIFLDQFNLAAETRGLGCTWIGFLVGAAKLDPTLKKPLGMPMKNSIHASMIFGWPKYKYPRTIPHDPPPVKWLE